MYGDRLIDIDMTVSIGLSVMIAADRSIELNIARADDAVYRAKGGGRHRVVADYQIEAPAAPEVLWTKAQDRSRLGVIQPKRH